MRYHTALKVAVVNFVHDWAKDPMQNDKEVVNDRLLRGRRVV